MICPECGSYVHPGQGLSACDNGAPDYIGGSECPYCGECIPDEEWQDPDDSIPF